MHGYPHFSFWIPITLAKSYFFPIVITFAKRHLYQEALSLSWLITLGALTAFMIFFFQILPAAFGKRRALSTNVGSASKSEPLAQSKGRYMVTLIPGDGVGPELVHSVKRVFR